jgi:hypothetical protein
MTLLRVTQVVPDLRVAPIAWKAREFVLIRSLIGKGRFTAPW